MTVLFRRILSAFLIFLVFSVVAQDDVHIKISKKKILTDGKYYYSHVVKKGETLIAISKAYNILQKDIVMENPEAIQGLKPDMILKIPVVEDKTKFIYHTVEKGQTLYAIAKKYHTEISILQKNNPAIENGLKIGMELKIPKKESTKKGEDTTQKEKEQLNKKQEPTKDSGTTKEQIIEKKEITKEDSKVNGKDNKINHVVEKGETIYALTKKYQITETQLNEANPEIKANGLKIGETLIIPVPDVNVQQKQHPAADVKTETIAVPEVKKQDEKNINKNEQSQLQPIVTPVNTDCAGFDLKKYKKPFKIALLSPFYIAQNRGYALKVKKKDEEPPIYPKSIKFIEFYQGLLLALDSLKKEGLSIEMLVYDTERDSAKIAAITQRKEFADVDLIIGPFFSANLKHFSDFAKNNKIPIVSPLSQNNEFLKNNPFAYHINASNNTLIIEAANYFSDSQEVNFLSINTGKKDDSTLVAEFKTKLFELYNKKFKTNPPHFKDIIYRKVGFKGVQESLSKDIDNVIFIPSVSETTVASILNKLNILETKFPIYLLGMQSWAMEDNIEPDYLFNLQYTYFTSMYVDYKRPEVIKFVNLYHSFYNAEPSKYSFQGYDIAMYFVNALKTYGRDFTGCIANDTKLNKKGLQTEFLFNKLESNSGFENTKSFIIQFDKEFNISHVNIEQPEIKQ